MINEWSISYCAWQWISDSLYASDYHFDDSEHFSYIKSQRLGFSSSQTEYADFLIFRYEYKNKSENYYNQVLLGLYMDFNVTNMTHMNDLCGYYDSIGMAYMFDENLPSTYVGIKILPDVPGKGFNFYWPEDMPYEDEYYYELLSDMSAPGIIPDTAGSYAVLVNAGPFFLNPLDSLTIYYGVAAGTCFSDMVENACAMQNFFDSSFLHVEEISRPEPSAEISIVPEPSSGFFTISMFSDNILPVQVEYFDLSGRTVLKTEYLSLRHGMNELPEDISFFLPGTYFVKISWDNFYAVKRITLIK